MTTTARIAVICAAITLGAGALVPAEAQPLDGNWWVGLDDAPGGQTETQLMKGLYARGVLHGVIASGLLATTQGGTGDTANQTVSRFALGITARQVSDGLDDLYRDFRNRRIPLDNAATVVLMQIGGVPQARIDALIESLRSSPPK